MIVNRLIIDADPGIADAVALTMALFDPAIDVTAVTAVAGNVSAELATRNVQAVIEQLDPPRWPRIGGATAPDGGLSVSSTHLFGVDGLGNANFPIADLAHRHPAERVMSDEVRSAPDQIKIVALGPLTNIARALQREPSLAQRLGQVVILGGTLNGPGNITPSAEFNIYADPAAARAVFRSPLTKTLIPLDVTSQVVFSYDLLDRLPDESTRAGRFLRKTLPFLFRAHRQVLGLEGVHLHDAVALAAVVHPELFEVEMVAADVELSGELTTGMTVFDRRPVPEWRPNMHVAVSVDVAGVQDFILRSLSAAGAASAAQ